MTAGESMEEKIDKLNKNAWDIRVSDSNKARELSAEAINLAEDIGYARGKAEGYRTFGFSYIRVSKYKHRLTVFRYCWY